MARRAAGWLGLCGAALLLAGCGDMPILFPKGPIALTERDILFRAFYIMLIPVIPVFLMTFWFAWRYRASNTKAHYKPNWEYAGLVDAITWIVPALIVMWLGYHVWVYTHRLDPYKPIMAETEPLEVRVIAQDWKWLFLYPKQDIAVVNELAFPSGVPLSFKITSDTVMNSFFIPALGSQIYAMAGMETRLNLLADEPGTFVGKNTQYSGDGFADQHFQAIAMSDDDFDAWVEKVRQSSQTLDETAYEALAKPSIAHPVTYYSGYEPELYKTIIMKYAGCETCPGHSGSH